MQTLPACILPAYPHICICTNPIPQVLGVILTVWYTLYTCWENHDATYNGFWAVKYQFKWNLNTHSNTIHFQRVNFPNLLITEIILVIMHMQSFNLLYNLSGQPSIYMFPIRVIVDHGGHFCSEGNVINDCSIILRCSKYTDFCGIINLVLFHWSYKIVFSDYCAPGSQDNIQHSSC